MPADAASAVRFSEYSDLDCNAQIDFGSIFSDLSGVFVDAGVSVYDEATDGDLGDWLGVFEDFENMTSYLIPGKDNEKYYVTIDYSDPFSYAMLVRDLSGSSYLKVILDSRTDQTENLKELWTLVQISDTLSSVNTITKMVYKQHSIHTDMDELREELLRTSYGTPQQRQEALRQVDELERDQSAFMLLTTILPLIFAGGSAAVGATMGDRASCSLRFSASLPLLRRCSGSFERHISRECCSASTLSLIPAAMCTIRKQMSGSRAQRQRRIIFRSLQMQPKNFGRIRLPPIRMGSFGTVRNTTRATRFIPMQTENMHGTCRRAGGA